jgi:hypothetical protein
MAMDEKEKTDEPSQQPVQTVRVILWFEHREMEQQEHRPDAACHSMNRKETSL